VLFNRTVSWEDNTKIMAWVAVLPGNAGLRKWVLMQLIKGASTLRVSSKGEKGSPRIVFREGRQDQEISAFLRWRRLIKKANVKYGESRIAKTKGIMASTRAGTSGL
jgi:hypothetical protein